jgi:hypothetical protein
MSAKKNVLANIIISLVIGVILGVLLVALSTFLDVSFLIYWGLVVVGILTIISNIPALVNGIMNVNKASGIVDLVFSILGIVLGLMMIFVQGTVITVIVAVYLIAMPIVRIVLAGNAGWKDQIKREWIKMLIGVLLLVFLPGLLAAADTVVKTIILIAGWVVIGLSVLFFVLSLISYLAASKKVADAAPVETTAEENKAE